MGHGLKLVANSLQGAKINSSLFCFARLLMIFLRNNVFGDGNNVAKYPKKSDLLFLFKQVCLRIEPVSVCDDHEVKLTFTSSPRHSVVRAHKHTEQAQELKGTYAMSLNK